MADRFFRAMAKLRDLMTKARKWDLLLAMCHRLGIKDCDALKRAIDEKVDGDS
jgi:hypothetical protein